jgi:hypothetical protein
MSKNEFEATMFYNYFQHNVHALQGRTNKIKIKAYGNLFQIDDASFIGSVRVHMAMV